MANPLPYNLTISSQTASLLYHPPRDTDTNASDGWELVYPMVDNSIGPHRKGIGADFHKSTMAEASITFNWLGTAIYVYGNGTKESYKFSVDGQDIGETFNVPQGGLLGCMTGMQYEEHTAMLKVIGREGLAFQYADLTIGLGYPGKKIENRTIQAVEREDQPNPFFVFKNDSSDWHLSTQAAHIIFPNGTTSSTTRHMVTKGSSDGLSFNVTSASAFILWGSLDRDHSIKRVTIFPDPRSGNSTRPKETFMFDIGRYLDYQQILYWESGLDRETSYTVDILPFAPQQTLAFNELQLLDGGSLPPSPPNPAPSAMDEGRHRQLAPKDITVIVVVPILVLAAIGVGGLWFCRRIKKKQAPVIKSHEGMTMNAPPDQQPHLISQSPSREIDGGPLPPQYDPSWAVEPSGDENVAPNPIIETAEVQGGERKWRIFGRNGRTK
ncbi:hypothetical protein PM082_004342 [Marasmius tenuissimus]|nr:hypothetical protein PM082_004342 [Marasmius tenuissimus]